MSVNKKKKLEQSGSGSILSFIKVIKKDDESQTQPSCSKYVTASIVNVNTNDATSEDGDGDSMIVDMARSDHPDQPLPLQPCLTPTIEPESSSHLPHDIGNFIVKQVSRF